MSDAERIGKALSRREGMRGWVSGWRTVPPSEILIFIFPRHEAGYAGHLLSLFQERLPVKRSSLGAGRSSASCFLCGCPGHEHGLCQTVSRGPARSCVCLPSMDTRARNVGTASHQPLHGVPIQSYRGSPFKFGVRIQPWVSVGFSDGLS